MRVRNHVAIGGNDQSGTDALRCPVVAAIKLEVLVIAVFRNRLLRRDVHHRGLDVGHDLDDRLLGDVDRPGGMPHLALRRGQSRGLRHRRLGLAGGRRRDLGTQGCPRDQGEKKEYNGNELANFHKAIYFTYDLSWLGIKLRE